MKTTASGQIHPVERFLLLAEQPPWQAVYRAAIGFLSLPLYFRWYGEDGPVWALVLFIVGVLFLLRLVPAILRQVLPFSKEIQLLWSRQRQLAKQYDSYQWRKLFWIGLGFAGYLAFSRRLRGDPLVLVSVCLVAGGLGLVVWRKVAMTRQSPDAPSSK